LSLLPLARRGLAPEVVLDHCQEAMGGQLLLAGLAGPEQASAVGGLWAELATVFTRLPGHDVIVDAGRAHSTAVHLPLLRQSQLVAGVFRPTVAGVMTLRSRLAALKDPLGAGRAGGPRVGVVSVDDVQHQREALAAVSGIQAELPWVESFGQVALDRKAAVMFDGQPVSRPERTMLVRSGQRLADTLARSVAAPEVPEAGEVGEVGQVAGADVVADAEPGMPREAFDTDEDTRANRRRSRGVLRRRSQV
jgi:hypothetical protein